MAVVNRASRRSTPQIQEGDPIVEGAGSSVGESGFWVKAKRRGREVVGKGALMAGIGLFALGAAGCDNKQNTEPPNASQTSQQVDESWESRKIRAIKAAEKKLQDSHSIRSMEKGSKLGPNEALIRFGDMLITPSEEPGWHRRVRENLSGKPHSNQEIQEAMIESVIRIKEDMNKVLTIRQVDLNHQEFKLLEKNLDKNTMNAVLKAYE